jgi:hypothetical protein
MYNTCHGLTNDSRVAATAAAIAGQGTVIPMIQWRPDPLAGKLDPQAAGPGLAESERPETVTMGSKQPKSLVASS